MPARRQRGVPSIKGFEALCERWGTPPPSLTPDAINYIARGLFHESRLQKRRGGQARSRREWATVARFLGSLRDIFQDPNTTSLENLNVQYSSADNQEDAGGRPTVDSPDLEPTVSEHTSDEDHEHPDDNIEGANDHDSNSALAMNGDDSEEITLQQPGNLDNSSGARAATQSRSSERVQASARSFSAVELRLLGLVLETVEEGARGLCEALDIVINLQYGMRAHVLEDYLSDIIEHLVGILSNLYP